MNIPRPPLVFAQLPKAGLGNMLFVWGRALVFAHINKLPFYHSSWVHFKLGPLLRREHSLRLYSGYFKNSYRLNPLTEIAVTRLLSKEIEPDIALLPKNRRHKSVFMFEAIPHWQDYFVGIREHREFVKQTLLNLVTPNYKELSRQSTAPIIGVHVRLGDFKLLAPGADFKSVGSTRTPITYFIERIEAIRAIHGTNLPVTVFSDGRDEELQALLTLPQVSRAPRNADIVDMLVLAQSRLIITSAHSTFGFWAGYLADVPLLVHPDHTHAPIRPLLTNIHYFEGAVTANPTEWPQLLLDNIVAIKA